MVPKDWMGLGRSRVSLRTESPGPTELRESVLLGTTVSSLEQRQSTTREKEGPSLRPLTTTIQSEEVPPFSQLNVGGDGRRQG